MRATSDDPLAAKLLETLSELLERHERIGRVLSEAIRSLATLSGPGPGFAGDQPGAHDSTTVPPSAVSPPGAPFSSVWKRCRQSNLRGLRAGRFSIPRGDGGEPDPVSDRDESRRLATCALRTPLPIRKHLGPDAGATATQLPKPPGGKLAGALALRFVRQQSAGGAAFWLGAHDALTAVCEFGLAGGTLAIPLMFRGRPFAFGTGSSPQTPRWRGRTNLDRLPSQEVPRTTRHAGQAPTPTAAADRSGSSPQMKRSELVALHFTLMHPLPGRRNTPCSTTQACCQSPAPRPPQHRCHSGCNTVQGTLFGSGPFFCPRTPSGQRRAICAHPCRRFPTLRTGSVPQGDQCSRQGIGLEP